MEIKGVRVDVSESKVSCLSAHKHTRHGHRHTRTVQYGAVRCSAVQAVHQKWSPLHLQRHFPLLYILCTTRTNECSFYTRISRLHCLCTTFPIIPFAIS